METRFAMSLLSLLVGCSGGPQSVDLPPEQMVQEYFLDPHPGTAPLLASATYATDEGDECSPPSWDELHPDHPSLDWPFIRAAVIGESPDAHPSLPPISSGARAFAIYASGTVEGYGRRVMLATTWNGTEIPCVGGNLSSGAVVIRSMWIEDEPSDSDVFEAASARVDAVGLIPLDDLDVALE